MEEQPIPDENVTMSEEGNAAIVADEIHVDSSQISDVEGQVNLSTIDTNEYEKDSLLIAETASVEQNLIFMEVNDETDVAEHSQIQDDTVYELVLHEQTDAKNTEYSEEISYDETELNNEMQTVVVSEQISDEINEVETSDKFEEMDSNSVPSKVDDSLQHAQLIIEGPDLPSEMETVDIVKILSTDALDKITDGISSKVYSTVNDDDQQLEVIELLSEVGGAKESVASAGTKIVTVPLSVNGKLSELPIELLDWTELSQQGFVAIAEDGTTVPVTVIQDNDFTASDAQIQDNAEQLSVSEQNVGSELISVVTLENVPKPRVPKTLKDVMAMTSSSRKQLQDGQRPFTQSTNLTLSSATSSKTKMTTKTNAIQTKLQQKKHQVTVSNSRDCSKISVSSPLATALSGKAQGAIVSTPQRGGMFSALPQPIAKISSVTTCEPPSEVASNSGERVLIRSSKERDHLKIDLSNVTQSSISQDNMQKLVQILQALPNSTRGQTVQIILRNDAGDGEEAVTTTHTIISHQEKSQSNSLEKAKAARLKTVKNAKLSSVTTSDIGTQVSPESLQEALAPPVEAADNTDTAVEPEVNVHEENLKESMGDLSAEEGESKTKSRPGRKPKRVSKVITVEQRLVVDPQPGVSYYAVVDYLSEQEQEGYSSGTELRRPEAAYSGFMEDHLELQNMLDEVKNSSFLESTVNSSVVVSPFRKIKFKPKIALVKEIQADVDNSENNEQTSAIDLPDSASTENSVTIDDNHYKEVMELEDALLGDILQPKKNVRRRSRSARVRHQHCCGYCLFGSREKIVVVEHCILQHPNEPVKTLSLMPQLMGRVCPYCRKVFDPQEFFSHMRFAHSEVHPYKCGYCDFMGRDRNQIRHHIQKKHRQPIKIINLQNAAEKMIDINDGTGESAFEGKKRIMGGNKPGTVSEGEDSVYEYMTDEDEDEGDDVESQKPIQCPECKKSFKTLKYLKTHVRIHQALRYQCGYCDFTSVMLHQVIRHCQTRHADFDPKVLTKELEPEKNPIVSKDIDSVLRQVYSLNTRLPRDPDGSKWMRKWCCPHCDYTCQFGASYRRHLRMHANVLPYKCNYCSFKGREKYYVRRHIYRMHKGVPMIVIENTPENCQMDSSSDEGYQEKGMRRRRRRKTKRLKSVVPVDGLKCNAQSDKFQKLPVGERGTSKRKVVDTTEKASVASEESSSRQSIGSNLYPRLPRAKDWSGENISDYILEREGDKIICKVCGQKTLSKAFYKHARKHFKIKPFKCGYCNYMSVERAKIRVHNTIKHPNSPFRIEECHLASILPREFMDLIGDNNNVAPNSTAAVEKVFNDEQLQSQQQLIQVPILETPQLNCPVCQEMVFYEETILRDHFYVHYDYYPFICSVCHFKATSSDRVIQHGAISHTGEEILVYQLDMEKPEGLEDTILQFMGEGEAIVQQKLLEIIDQTTKANEQNRSHETNNVESNEEQFECPVCDRRMNLHVATIRRHLYSHHQYKPFKCGYCEFQGVSKANIKQHTVTHGSVAPVIEILKDLEMPEALERMLREVQTTLKMTLIESKGEEVADSRDDAFTKEEQIWKDKFASGECPCCGASVGSLQSDVQKHIMSHLEEDGDSPSANFSCEHCDEKFHSLDEANAHHQEIHQSLEPKILTVPAVSLGKDQVTLCKALLKYINDEKNIDDLKIELKSTESKATSETDASDTKKGNSAIEYQVVIVSDDKETVIPVTAMDNLDSQSSESGQNYALILEQGEDGTVKAAKMIKDSAYEITNETIAKPNDNNDDASFAKGKQKDLKISVGLPEKDKPLEYYDDSGDSDIITIGGVLLTRPFQSEAEGVSDKDDADVKDENEGSEKDSVEIVSDDSSFLKQTGSTTSSSASKETEQLNFACKLCDRKFIRKVGLEAHIIKVHGRKSPKWKCGYCEFSNNDRKLVQAHCAVEHSEKPVLLKDTNSVKYVKKDVSKDKLVKINKKLSTVKTSPPELPAEKPDDDMETVENISKMVKKMEPENPPPEVEVSKRQSHKMLTKSRGQKRKMSADLKAKSTESVKHKKRKTDATSAATSASTVTNITENFENSSKITPNILHILKLKPNKELPEKADTSASLSNNPSN